NGSLHVAPPKRGYRTHLGFARTAHTSAPPCLRAGCRRVSRSGSLPGLAPTLAILDVVEREHFAARVFVLLEHVLGPLSLCVGPAWGAWGAHTLSFLCGNARSERRHEQHPPRVRTTGPQQLNLDNLGACAL